LAFADVAGPRADDALDTAPAAQVQGALVGWQGRGAGGGSAVAASPAGGKDVFELAVQAGQRGEILVEVLAAALVNAEDGRLPADLARPGLRGGGGVHGAPRWCGRDGQAGGGRLCVAGGG